MLRMKRPVKGGSLLPWPDSPLAPPLTAIINLTIDSTKHLLGAMVQKEESGGIIKVYRSFFPLTQSAMNAVLS